MNTLTEKYSQFLQYLEDSIVYVIIGIVLIVLFALAVKYQSFGIYAFYFITSILVIVGITSSIQLVDMFDDVSKEVGSAIHIEMEEDFESVSYFDYGIIDLQSNDYITYKNVKSFDSQEFDGTNRDYIILFNDMPCNNIVLNPGSISGVFVLNFYDVNGDVETTSELSILIEYLDKETKVSTSIVNTNNSVSYLNTFMELHGSIIEVVER